MHCAIPQVQQHQLVLFFAFQQDFLQCCIELCSARNQLAYRPIIQDKHSMLLRLLFVTKIAHFQKMREEDAFQLSINVSAFCIEKDET